MSTLDLNRAKAGTIQAPQLHLTPIQLNCPSFPAHFGQHIPPSDTLRMVDSSHDSSCTKREKLQKGFTKAITRLPHMVLQKAGAADETKDSDFNGLAACFEKTSATTDRLHDDMLKYRDGVRDMLDHQRSILEAFMAVLEREDGARSSVVVSRNIGQIQLVLDSLQRRRSEILDALDCSLTDRALKILDEVSAAQRGMASKITKRNHKLLDFDRHRHTVKKYEADKSRSISDERKMVKTEQLLHEAEEEYLKYNDQLKTDLPIYLKLHSQLMQPVLENMVRFQRLLYRSQRDALANISALGDYASILGRHEDEAAEALATLNEIPMLQAMTGRIKRQPSLSKPTANRSSGRSSIRDSPTKTRDIPLRTLDVPEKYLSVQKAPAQEIKTKYNTREDVRKEKIQDTVIANTVVNTTQPPPTVEVYVPRNRTGNRVAELASKLNGLNLTPTGSTSPSAKIPPPVPMKKEVVVALYDYVGQETGDLSFREGDQIEVVKRTDSKDDWWTGSLHGKTGIFPANYVS
ncbi:hypothetical protein PSACC_00631 [Paramicrosporidium saccamoebae]|uniref:Uncharacterized protein n=1 Tax=Paramicrosporidium saccamoebae TaxID=1246581 RepID=A0A2H9TP64_9FUNG|nr:hypothetical protein PSACC_00631 [Paramicrosporidium saccamoebae]